MVLLLKVAHGYTERQIGFNSTKLLKDGYWWLRFKYQAPGSSKKISIALFVKLQINNKNKNEKYWGKIDWK